MMKKKYTGVQFRGILFRILSIVVGGSVATLDAEGRLCCAELAYAAFFPVVANDRD